MERALEDSGVTDTDAPVTVVVADDNGTYEIDSPR